MASTRLARLLPLAAAAMFVCLLATARPAGADGGEGCSAPLTRPFQPFLDPFAYAPVPGGSFEPGDAAWQLSGGASLVGDNEPWHVGGTGGDALALGSGAAALSPPFCITPLSPTIRFFVRTTSLLPSLATVAVEIDAGSGTITVPLGAVVATPGWQPSPPLPLLANATSALGGSFTTARLRVTAVAGEVRVDDVYVDPFKTS